MPIRQQQEAANHQKAQGHGQQLVSREKSDGEADESDQREGTDAAEGVGTANGGFVLFSFEPDQEREEENDDDFYGIRWKPAVEIHSRLRLLGMRAV